MNKDQIKGRVNEATGKTKEAAGRVSGDRDLEDHGTAEKVSGKIQKTYGDVKEDIKDNVDRSDRSKI